MNRQHALVAAMAGAGLLIVPCLLLGEGATSAPAARTNPTPMTQASIAAGKAIFFEYCSGCHGRRADGRGMQALNLNPRPQNLRNAAFVKYLSDERVFSSISGGVRGTAMPTFEFVLTTDKRWDVINYIRSLTAGDARDLPNAPRHQDVAADAKNPLQATPAVIEAGRRSFMNFCASCHGATADGRGVLAANLVPAPRNLVRVVSFGEKPFIDYLADARLYDSITNGVPGTSMQPWITALTDEQRWQIITFMRSLADAERASKK